MPTRPPLCPAQTHAKSASLATIHEDLAPAYGSPLLPHESAIFVGFEFPLPPAAFSPSTGFNFTFAQPGNLTASPGLSRKLDTLSLSYQRIDPILANVDSKRVRDSIFHIPHSGGAGLGLNLLNCDIKPSSPFLPLAVQLSASSNADYDFEEDDVDPSNRSFVSARSTPPLTDSESIDEDTMPLQTWLEYRMEEAKCREEYEQELGETNPVAVDAQGPQDDELIKAQDQEGEEEEEEEPVIISERKIVRLSKPAMAGLRYRASLVDTPTKPSKASDEVTPRANRVVLAEEASPRNAIFSPPHLPSHKRKASAASVLSTNSTLSTISASGPKSRKTRRLSTSLPSGRHTSFSISPLFSSKFLRGISSSNTGTSSSPVRLASRPLSEVRQLGSNAGSGELPSEGTFGRKMGLRRSLPFLGSKALV